MGDLMKERAEVGGEFVQQQGKGTGGVLAEAVTNVVTGMDGPDHEQPFHSVVNRPLNGNHLGESLEHLAIKSELTGEAPPFSPYPDVALPKEYETRVQVIQKYPEMKTVEETYYVKEVQTETRTVRVPRARVVMEEHEKVDMVPVVKQVPKTRTETVYTVVEEQREVTDFVPVVEMLPVPRIEKIPRVISEEVEETVEVPTVIEVPRRRTIEVPTGNFCEVETGTYVNPTHFNLLGKKGHGVLRRSTSSASSTSSSSGDEQQGRGFDSTGTNSMEGVEIAPGPATVSQARDPSKRKKKKSLLQRIEKKIVG